MRSALLFFKKIIVYAIAEIRFIFGRFGNSQEEARIVLKVPEFRRLTPIDYQTQR